MGQGNRSGTGEILFEFTRVGGQMRVAAIHAPSGIEVVAIAPATATRQQMQQLALAKLRRRLDAGEPKGS